MRTDSHRPSQIVPQDYRFVACDYFGPHAELIMASERMIYRNDAQVTGGTLSQHDHGGTCHICGAGALYVARFHHAKSNVYITTGMDCAEKLDMGNPRAFKALRKRVADVRQAEAGKAKAQALLGDRNLAAAWAIYAAKDTSGFKKQEEILVDVVGKLVRYGSLSDPQYGLVAKLLGDIAQRPAREAAFQAQRAQDVAGSKHVGTVGQRQAFSLTVERIFRGEGNFGPFVILTMKDQAGNVVVYKGGNDYGLAKGDAVKMVATIKSHDAWQGIAQTVIARPKVAQAPASPEASGEAS